MSIAAALIHPASPLTSDLGRRMKCARVALDLTQEQLASRLGIARQTLTGYEKGHTDPPWSLLARMCAEYGIDAQWLLLGADGAPLFTEGQYSTGSPVARGVQ